MSEGRGWRALKQQAGPKGSTASQQNMVFKFCYILLGQSAIAVQHTSKAYGIRQQQCTLSDGPVWASVVILLPVLPGSLMGSLELEFRLGTKVHEGLTHLPDSSCGAPLGYWGLLPVASRNTY